MFCLKKSHFLNFFAFFLQLNNLRKMFTKYKPPAQDSPKNVVNILNDYCIQQVLLKLDNLDDFFSAAQVCTRFQENAKACFRFENISFSYGVSNDSVLFEFAEDFLSLFGPRIQSIHCDFGCHTFQQKQLNVFTEMDHENNLSLISKYCGQTLNGLEIKSRYADGIILTLRSPIKALRSLKLDHVSLYSFNPSLMIPQLQNLEMSSIYVDWLANHFPMLRHIKMSRIFNLTSELFIEFQKLNPKLQSIGTGFFRYRNPWEYTDHASAWENIADRLPNIVALSFFELGPYIIHMSAFHHLKKLHLSENMRFFPSRLLFRSFIKRNKTIEELKIRGVDAALGDVLKELTSIKVLHIDNTSENVAFKLVNHLPNLEHLHLNNNRISLLTIKNILENCEKMTEFNIYNYVAVNGTIDLKEYANEYKSVVALATGRVKVRILYVPNKVHRRVNKRLEREFSSYNNDWIWFGSNKRIFEQLLKA